MNKHNRVRISGKGEKGFTKREKVEFAFLILFALLGGAAVLATIVALLRLALEKM